MRWDSQGYSSTLLEMREQIGPFVLPVPLSTLWHHRQLGLSRLVIGGSCIKLWESSLELHDGNAMQKQKAILARVLRRGQWEVWETTRSLDDRSFPLA